MLVTLARRVHWPNETLIPLIADKTPFYPCFHALRFLRHVSQVRLTTLYPVTLIGSDQLFVCNVMLMGSRNHAMQRGNQNLINNEDY